MKWGQLNQGAAGAGLFLLGMGLQWWATQTSSAAAFGVGALLLIMALIQIGFLARRLSDTYNPVVSWGLAIGIILLLNVFYNTLSFSAPSWLVGFFQTPVLKGKLAHLPLNSLLALWLLSVAQHSFRRLDVQQWSLRKKMGLAFICYSTISLGVLMAILLIRSLVLYSGLVYDFQNIFNLGLLSFISICSIVSFLFSLLLLSFWVGRKLLALSRQQRLGAIGASLLFSALLIVVLPLDISLLTGILILLIHLILLDLYIDLDAGSPAWLIIWLALPAALGAVFFFKYKLDKGSQERLAFAQGLAAPRDSLAEVHLAALMKADTSLRRLAEEQFVKEKAELLLLEAYPYLGKNYRLDWDTAAALPTGKQLASGIYLLPPNASYHTYAIGPYPQNGSQPGWMMLRPVISRNEAYGNRGPERVLQELIPDSPVRLPSYDFVVYFQGKPAARRGDFPEGLVPRESAAFQIETEPWKEKLNSQYAALFYSTPNGYQVVVGEALGGYLKPLSLFSYLFALLLLLSLLVFSSNQYLRPFPETPPEVLIGEPSLRHRIQLTFIGLTLAAFFFIGLATVAYFRRTALQNHQERLFETVNVLVRSIGLEGTPPIDGLSLNRLSNTHKVDINIYDSNGQLLASSAPFLFQNGWKAPRMAPAAHQALENRNFRPVVLNEQAQGLPYKAAYVALPNEEGNPAFFLQIPYTAADQSLQESVVEFMGALLNFYVFLLLMGGALAIAVANSITRPLSAIGEKLRNFSLDSNEPLEWNSEDEIGKLVEAYNQMIAELEESTKKLRQSEREGAWREMAKQVAHEIKNPLTPMKLSIQYLQHAQQSDPERAAALIKRVSQTLIEQIDGLAHIATEFSNFAKMPKAQNEQLVLNDVVTSVYNLFTEHQEPAEDIQLQLPEGPVLAITDKKQLVRVLTNLIKNAQQAIPEERQGRISIQLYQQSGLSVIKVSDNGTGIPEEVQPRVFQPNFTTKSSGMGLGLAMCKGIIEAAGGQLYFETQVGAGTDFFVELPGG